MAATPEPTTAASSVSPVWAAMAWPAAMVSHETRFSLPSRCSTTTRIVFAIKSVPGSQLKNSGGYREPGTENFVSDYPQLVLQLIHQFLCYLCRRAFQKFGVLRFLGQVQFFDLLQIRAQRRLNLS